LIRQSLQAFLILCSSLALLGFLIVGVRVVIRSDVLDPTEVAVIGIADRMANNQAMYDEPEHHDEPALMPGFPFLVWGLSSLFGPGLWVPRALALLATLVLTWLVLTIVRIETKNWTLAMTSAGSILMGYSILTEPPGVARPDTLMLLLVVLGYFTLRVTEGVWGALLAAVLMSAAVFTQQQAGWFVAAAFFALALDDRKRLVAFTLAVGAAVGGGYVAFSKWLGPWFNFAAWDGPFHALHFRPVGPVHYLGDYLLGKLGVLTLAAVLSFAMPIRPWRGKGGLWTCMGFATLAAGLLSTQTLAFGPQSLIPTLVVFALLGAVAMQRVTQHLSAYPGSNRLGGQGVVMAALALQFVVFLSSLSQSHWFVGPLLPSDPHHAVRSVSTAPRSPLG
jgi:hypothetical protein